MIHNLVCLLPWIYCIEISGHHVYKEICTSFVGIVLRVKQEPLYMQERFAVTLVKDDIIHSWLCVS